MESSITVVLRRLRFKESHGRSRLGIPASSFGIRKGKSPTRWCSERRWLFSKRICGVSYFLKRNSKSAIHVAVRSLHLARAVRFGTNLQIKHGMSPARDIPVACRLDCISKRLPGVTSYLPAGCVLRISSTTRYVDSPTRHVVEREPR